MTTTQTKVPALSQTPADQGTRSPAELQRRRTGIETFEFPAGMPTRLMNGQGWSEPFTQTVLGEYRRFLILAATAGVNVTPSRTVDHAWHAHLEYTRSYWTALCQEVLGEPLHHTPGEPGDDAHFRAQYLFTLDLYRATFGHPAPATCWPDPRPRPARRMESPLHQAGETSPAALAGTTIAAVMALCCGMLGGGALLTLLGGMLLIGTLILAASTPVSTGQDGRDRTGRTGDGTSDGNGDGLLLASDRGAGDSVDHGSGDHGDSGDGSGHASCAASCGSGCGGGCGS